PIAGRHHPKLEGMVGLLINTLVLRAQLAQTSTFAHLLAQVREQALQAYAHQDLPFEKLVEELAPQRDLSRSPLIQVLFVFQNTPLMELALPNLSISELPQQSQVSRFDLSLVLREQEGELLVQIEYRSDLFEAATMERF